MPKMTNAKLWEHIVRFAKSAEACRDSMRWLNEQHRLGLSPAQAWNKCKRTEWVVFLTDECWMYLHPDDDRAPPRQFDIGSHTSDQWRKHWPWERMKKLLTNTFKKMRAKER